MLTSAFDKVASSFDRHRALPSGAAAAIRAAVLAGVAASSARPRLLDIGSGSGRIGCEFVAAGDDYVGVDISAGMLDEFVRRAAAHDGAPRLVLADGRLLPFGDATFDGVMLIQAFGGLRGWRRLIAEARRVLRPAGSLIVGRTVAPDDGLDAWMKQRLALILDKLGVEPERANPRAEIESALTAAAAAARRMIAANWTAEPTPRGFLERHRTGARFSALPTAIKQQALGELAAAALAAYGSLDAMRRERRDFELQIFNFTS